MKNIIQSISLVFLITVLAMGMAHAEMNQDEVNARSRNKAQKAGECVPATGNSQLDINNVRAYITTAGSMWFRNGAAQYFIPKEGQASSMFAAALWIGGMDVAGQLKLAAVRFRQMGEDFWPGPLTRDTANIDQNTCALYDKIFVMTKQMAKDHMEKQGKESGYVMPEAIRNWPGNPIDGNAAQSWYIAPYVDVDENGIYSPEGGDYPYYDFDNKLCPWTTENRAKAVRGELDPTMETNDGISTGGILADQVLKGDQTLWWVFNDKGAAHTESKGYPIGLEIRAQAFGFATTDELNNMSFYSYEIINRSTQELTETFFSQWVDPDLGYAYDDYVGCDVERGLGYCYNGKTPDGNGLIVHYGDNPPAVGVDFFQGPYLDPDGEDNPSFRGDNIHGPSFAKNYPGTDGKGCAIVQANGNAYEFTWDSLGANEEKIPITRYVTVRAEAINGVNFGDGIPDNERYGMRRFVYHNNDGTVRGDPSVAIDYYNLLKGIWKDNVKMTYGGTGYDRGSTIYCDFMFPGSTDPCNWGTNGVPTNYSDNQGWTEESEENQPGDRRFMQSAGPFTLKAGAINYITVGIPWARAVGAPWASVQLLKIVDDKAQRLFESCFKVLEGPDAPDLAFRERDGEVICYITNAVGSRNYKEMYEEKDETIPEYRPITHTEIVDTTFYRYVYDTLLMDYVLDSVTFPTPHYTTDTIWYDRFYRFEGYQVYQLVDPTVKAGELSDITKAQLVYQCDIQNDIKTIINYEYDATVGTEVPREKASGANEGILHSFSITKDMFGASRGTGLVNYKKYYYMAIAYAYNSYAPIPYGTSPDNPDALYGQKNPYLAGNKNVKVYTVLPHKNAIEENGTVAQSAYGTQPQIIQYEGHGNGGNELQLTQKTIKEILDKGKADSLVFEKNAGPISVRVIDPLKVVGLDYTLRFCDKKKTADVGDVVLHTIIGIKQTSTSKTEKDTFVMVMSDSVSENTYWVLEYKNANGVDTVICSDANVYAQNDQILLDLGISIFIKDARFTPLDDNLKPTHETVYKMYSSVTFLNSSIKYQAQGRNWYQGLPDVDGTSYNWIRAGQTRSGDWTINKQNWSQIKDEDFYIKLHTQDTTIVKDASKDKHTVWLDKGKQFEKIFGNVLAPYALASIWGDYPAYSYELCTGGDSVPKAIDLQGGGNPCRRVYPCMTELYSVDIVLTADTLLWTRCPVVEMNCDRKWSEGNAVRHNLRKHPSVYRNGQPDNSGTTGMGWFPGYAICVETGERLNMMFAENSMQGGINGANMIFDPTSDLDRQHHLYVFGHRNLYEDRNAGNNVVLNTQDTNICPAYDEGEWLYRKFVMMEGMLSNTIPQQVLKSIAKNYIYKNAMWTGIALSHPQYKWLEKGNDVTIQIRVSRPYQRWDSKTGVGKVNHQNNNMPLYKFSTKDIATLTNVKAVAQEQMDSIYITPNPYYGTSAGGYEISQVDTRVKFVNLPKTCEIRIYTLNGTLIRHLNKDNADTFMEWDLKNSANIPIASGMYLIHVRDSKYGTEKTLKFLCIQRPIDVNSF